MDSKIFQIIVEGPTSRQGQLLGGQKIHIKWGKQDRQGVQGSSLIEGPKKEVELTIRGYHWKGDINLILFLIPVKFGGRRSIRCGTKIFFII